MPWWVTTILMPLYAGGMAFRAVQWYREMAYPAMIDAGRLALDLIFWPVGYLVRFLFVMEIKHMKLQTKKVLVQTLQEMIEAEERKNEREDENGDL